MLDRPDAGLRGLTMTNVDPEAATDAPAEVEPNSATVGLLIDGLGLARRTRIVDVGANPVHEAPYAALLRMGGCDVIGFEPQPSAFAELAKIKSDRETYLPFAVGDGSSKELKVYRSSGFTSVYEPHLPGMAFLGGHKWGDVVQRIPMDTVALDAAEGVGEFDLLKIDIQGGEVDVFKGGERVLREAMVVIVELRYFRLYEDEPMLGGVDNELRRQGFYLHKFIFNKAGALPNSQASRLRRRRLRDQLIDGDGVYLRDMGKLASYSDEQVKHLCITAAAVFASHTLVLHCLDELVRRGAVAAEMPARYVDAMPAELRWS
jgi:FkbM family methyltransferase